VPEEEGGRGRGWVFRRTVRRRAGQSSGTSSPAHGKSGLEWGAATGDGAGGRRGATDRREGKRIRVPDLPLAGPGVAYLAGIDVGACGRRQ
jgi:hypothetical protein